MDPSRVPDNLTLPLMGFESFGHTIAKKLIVI